jgi:hypothetical protein
MPYIGRSTDGFGIRETFTYVATNGATTISGADSNGRTFVFDEPTYVDVFLNGVRLKKDTDYNLNTANTIAGLTALSANDEIEIIVNDIFTLADMVSAQSGGDFNGSVGIKQDSGSLSFGFNKEITLTHVADIGLKLKNTSTTGNSGVGAVLTLQTGDTDIAVNNVLGDIQFQAPDEAAGTDAILVAAAIKAMSEGNFSASNNATKLSFHTAASAAAAETMSLSSTGVLTTSSNIVSGGTITGGGLLTTGGNVVIPDAGTIGSASDTNAIAISSAGVITISTNTDSSNSTTGALVAHSAGFADDVNIGDQLNVGGAIAGSSTIIGTTITAQTAFVPDSSDGGSLGTSSLEFSDLYLADGGRVLFGNDADINLTHVADTGLTTNGSFTATTITGTTITASTAFVPDSSGGADLGTTALEFNDLYLNDAGSVIFGNDQDVSLEHDHNLGLIISRSNQSDNSPVTLVLQTGETDIAADDVIGKFSFQAPDEGAGTDAVLVAAAIQARSEGDFSSTSNATSIDFMTGASEAAATKMTLTSGGNLAINTDNAKISFGANSDITLTHVHNVGLLLTHTATDDNLPIILQLKSEENEIVANEVIGSLEFAAGDGDGTDGATVAAGIHAIAEDTFSATANATKLVFTTGVSETAAASATAKMTLSSAGLLTIADDFIIKNAGTIGSVGDPDAIAIASNGVVSFSQDLDIEGDIDVNGTTNLDVVDIDGAVNMALTALVTGVLTTTAATVFNGGFASNAGSTITVADNSAPLTLISTDADASVGPGLDLFRNSGSPADGDTLGQIYFHGENDADEKIEYTSIFGGISDMTDGTEDGFLRFNMISNGASKNIDMINGGLNFADSTVLSLGAGSDLTLTSDGTNGTIGAPNGNLLVDVVGDITLDAEGDEIHFKRGGVNNGRILMASTVFSIGSTENNGDVKIIGIDGGAELTALTFDMSDAGTAIFNNRIRAALASDGSPSYSFGDDTHTGMFSPGNDTIAFSTGGTERMRINSSGYIYVNTSGVDPSGSQVGVRITGTQGANFWMSANSGTGGYNHLTFFNGNGEVGSIVTASSATAYNTSSDYRLKENVVTDWDATTRLKQLKPSRFNFIADANTTVDGFLAHEAQAVVPECVTGTKDAVEVWKDGEELPDGISVGDNKLDDDGNTIPVMQGIDQSKLVPLLVKTLQEALAEIDTLKTKVQALEDA